MPHPVDEWLDEIEIFGLRYERLLEEVDRDPSVLRQWLKAAYDLGYGRAKVGVDQSRTAYSAGDFVAIYDGMGETGFGTVVGLDPEGGYIVDRSWGDGVVVYRGYEEQPSRLSTPEEAMEYLMKRLRKRQGRVCDERSAKAKASKGL